MQRRKVGGNPKEWAEIEEAAKAAGFAHVTTWMRVVALEKARKLNEERRRSEAAFARASMEVE